MSNQLTEKEVEEICELVEELSLTPQQACEKVGIDWSEVKDTIQDRSTEIGKKVAKAKAKAIEFWQKKLRKKSVSSGEYKAARIQLQALDPGRYLKKKNEGESFSVSVKTVDSSHLPKMPIENVFEGGEEE